ncbi:hypothetical protein NVP1170O_188 [Vibrio phage 1.170.O._10N.261.52.C3]|nr:hypothetical protein NVP1170O_188 [Vibrio phage 1.170.O._10N.261.52.C3]
MSKESGCLLKSEFPSLGWEICRRTDLTFDDIYIYHHKNVGEYVVMIRGKFAGYVDGFWHQGHLDKYIGGSNDIKRV